MHPFATTGCRVSLHLVSMRIHVLHVIRECSDQDIQNRNMVYESNAAKLFRVVFEIDV